MKEVKYDEIGPWSEIKIEIIRKYAAAYTQILSSNKLIKGFIYIDAFAGAGTHIKKGTGEEVLGTPRVALDIMPAFHEYHFIDLHAGKTALLQQLAKDRNDVFVYNENCNMALPERVYPRAKYADYKRALCILDPYGLHLDWRLMCDAGQMKSFDIFINFPIMDINMNLGKGDKSRILASDIGRMNAFWGDNSWEEHLHQKHVQPDLFGNERHFPEKKDVIVNAFKERLRDVAGFAHVPEPIPMRNKNNAIVYWLFFASQKPVASNIISDIFSKYT
jgi:three-Cys-motif partner protein